MHPAVDPGSTPGRSHPFNVLIRELDLPISDDGKHNRVDVRIHSHGTQVPVDQFRLCLEDAGRPGHVLGVRHDAYVRLEVPRGNHFISLRRPGLDLFIAPAFDHGGGSDHVIAHLLLPRDHDGVVIRGGEGLYEVDEALEG